MSKNIVKKIVIVSVVIGLIAVFKIFNLGQFLTISYIKESQENFATLYAEHRALVIAGYMMTYILVTSLSLPGAAVLTIAGGALFGLWTGALIVSFASTIGATSACFVARSLLRDWVESKFGNKISKVNEGIEREGSFYLPLQRHFFS